MPKTKVKEVSETNTNEVLTLLKQVVERLDKVENVINKPITSQAETLKENLVPNIQLTSNTNLLPIPADYRTLLDTLLNKYFGLELEVHTDAPVVTATIVVPDKYSSMTPSQREMMPRDIRPKVMTTAGGVNELREWVETVYRSFTPEVQAMIVLDR